MPATTQDTVKTCHECGESKPLKMFPARVRQPDGRGVVCKRCLHRADYNNRKRRKALRRKKAEHDAMLDQIIDAAVIAVVPDNERDGGDLHGLRCLYQPPGVVETKRGRVVGRRNHDLLWVGLYDPVYVYADRGGNVARAQYVALIRRQYLTFVPEMIG